MAKRATYLYKVIMQRGNGSEITEYCYARNKDCAVKGYKEIYKVEKFDCFNVINFAEADYDMHPEYFKPLSADEVEMVKKNNLAAAGAYRRIRDGSEMKGGEFITKEELEELL